MANSPETTPPETRPPKSWRNGRNGLIAIVAIVLSVALALGVRSGARGGSLAALAAQAVPLDVAIANGQPTIVEFYADWCTSCQAMAADMQELHDIYGDRLNFTMLNVDNGKWLPEILSYHVDGIPHFLFLNRSGQALGQAIGEQPKPVLTANLEALVADAPTLPYARAIAGQTSNFSAPVTTSKKPTAGEDPRSHGAQTQPQS